MIILGIESSCDETAAALIEVGGKNFNPDIRVLSNIISSQINIHAQYGGVVPEVAARKHAENIIPVIKKSLFDGARQLHDIDVIAVTAGPGLITSLRVGVDTAKTLSYILRVPLVPVNHVEGHIYSNWLPHIEKSQKHVAFPALILVVSGGHTELVLMKHHGKYSIIGKTRDDAVGEAFDKVAKILKLGYPGGPIISALAEKFNPASGHTITLPRPMIDSPDFDFSFAGLKTAVLYLVRDYTKRRPGEDITREVAYEFQRAAVEVLIKKTVRAAKKFHVKTVMLAGGVSANALLRNELGKAVKKFSSPIYIQPAFAYTTDNAAMIAVAGYFNYARGPKKYREMWEKINIDPNLSL